MPPADLDLTELLSLNKKKDHLPDLYIIGYVNLWKFVFKKNLFKVLVLPNIQLVLGYMLVVCFVIDLKIT